MRFVIVEFDNADGIGQNTLFIVWDTARHEAVMNNGYVIGYWTCEAAERVRNACEKGGEQRLRAAISTLRASWTKNLTLQPDGTEMLERAIGDLSELMRDNGIEVET